MPSSVKELLAAAAATVSKVEPQAVQKMLDEGGALLVDVRDPPEVAASGRIQGALAVSRGMLEFRADPASPYYNGAFRRDRPVILYCASGGRAALAGKTLQDLGFQSVHSAGAFKDLAAAGMPVEPA